VTAFVDTNVLVYARDLRAGEKHRAARRWMENLWNTHDGRLSYQVLQEFYVTVTMKLKPGMTVDAARRDVRALLEWKPRPVDQSVIEGAWMIQDRFRVSWWDALIVSSAQAAECEILLSEDFQEGQDFGGVRVVNPFKSQPA
jgi:predicted nucleic acid-binding protein